MKTNDKHYKIISAATFDQLESKLNYEYDAGRTSESIMRKDNDYWKPILMTCTRENYMVVILEKGTKG